MARQVIFWNQSVIISRIGNESDLIIELVFSAEEYRNLHFERNGRELNFKGSMFDICSIDTSGTTYFVRALKDEREARIMSGFLNSKDDEGANCAFFVSFMPYFLMLPLTGEPSPTMDGNLQWIPYDSEYADPYLITGSPPPKII